MSALEKLLKDGGGSPASRREEEVKEILEQIQSASEWIESIVKKVLGCARPSPPRLCGVPDRDPSRPAERAGLTSPGPL